MPPEAPPTPSDDMDLEERSPEAPALPDMDLESASWSSQGGRADGGSQLPLAGGLAFATAEQAAPPPPPDAHAANGRAAGPAAAADDKVSALSASGEAVQSESTAVAVEWPSSECSRYWWVRECARTEVHHACQAKCLLSVRCITAHRARVLGRPHVVFLSFLFFFLNGLPSSLIPHCCHGPCPVQLKDAVNLQSIKLSSGCLRQRYVRHCAVGLCAGRLKRAGAVPGPECAGAGGRMRTAVGQRCCARQQWRAAAHGAQHSYAGRFG